MMQEVEEPLLTNSPESENHASGENKLEVSINHDPPPSPDRTMIPQTNVLMPKRRVIKNMCVLCFSMFMFFTGFMALSNLQSTMNSARRLGTESQAVIYVASMASALFLPEFVVKNIGCRKALMIAVGCSLFYIAANFYPMMITLMPAAVLLGLSAGPLTTSQSIYVNEMAVRYSKNIMSDKPDVVVSRFFGFNSFATESTQIFGNLISYYVLSPSMVPVVNRSSEMRCGVNFINIDVNGTNGNIQPPTDEKRDWLVSIFLSFGFISVLLIKFFLDPLENDIELDDDAGKSKWKLLWTRVMAAITHIIKVDQLLLIPISIYCGIAISFYASDFTQAYIACSWGVHHVGFVTICFGVCGALMAILVGPLVKISSQMCVILFAALINVCTCIALYFWQPTPDAPVIYFVFAGLWGMSDAIWWSQIAALYGLMFPEDREAAFSNFFFWSFLGYFLSYSYANFFDVVVKINIMLAFLIVGIALYVVGRVKVKYWSQRSVYVPIDE